MYQEIASFLSQIDNESEVGEDYINLSDDKIKSIGLRFKKMLYDFKKKYGLIKEGLYDDVYPIVDGEEIDLIANLPKTGTKVEMLERAIFKIWFYCDSALKNHELGSKNVKKY